VDPVRASWFHLAVASAFVAGWIEAVTRFVPLFDGRLVFTDRHPFWITPLSYLIFLVPGGAAVALLARVIAPLRASGPRLFLQLLPPIFGVSWLLYPRIERYAIVALSLGLTVQLTRMAARRLAGLRRAVLRVATVGGALTAASAVLASALPAVAERRVLRSLPVGAEGSPNVILLVLDTVRAASLSAYGYSKPTTPTLEKLGERAVRFKHAFATTSWTLPSHASMLTGRYPYELSADWERSLDDAVPVVTEVFRDAGYRTGGFVANIEYTSAQTGLARGFVHFEDWPITLPRIAAESSLGFFILNNTTTRRMMGFYEPFTQRLAEDVIDGFLRWRQRTAGSGRPYFAFLNLYEAHAPFLPPEPYRGQFGASDARLPALTLGKMNGGALRPGEPLTPAELEDEQRAYDGGIAYLDAQIGRLLAILESEGELGSTAVVITSDHGEHFGEFGLRSHGTALYSPGLHVPLIIAYPPKAPPGMVVDRAVTLRDLAATMLDLAGIRAHKIPGRSLAGAWSGEPMTGEPSLILSELWPPRNVEEGVPVAHGYMRSLVNWPLQVIRRVDGKAEFFDLAAGSGDGETPIGGSQRVMLEEQLRAIPPTPFVGRLQDHRMSEEPAPSRSAR
jgi:arylsulfatase A-like enzyme